MAKAASINAANELSALELHALAQAGKAAAKQRDFLDEGAGQAVDITVRLTGLMNVGLAETRDKATKPDAVELLALVLEFLPAGTRRTIEKRLDAAYHLADSEARPELVPEFHQLAQKAIDRWTKYEEREQRAAVTGIIVASVLARGGKKLAA